MPATTGHDTFLRQAEAKLRDGLQKLDANGKYRQYMNVASTNLKVTRDQGLENMTALVRRIEGAPVQELNFKVGYGQAYVQVEYAGKVVMTFQMKTFQQYELFGKLTRQLKAAGMKTPEILCAMLLEYGDVALASVPQIDGSPAINSIGGDGLTLFNSAHPYKSDDERTWSNIYTASTTLDEETISAIRTQIRRWVDNTGAPLDYSIKGLVIPPDKRQDYLKLSKSQLEPATALNAVNTYKDLVMTDAAIELAWLASTTDFFVQTDAPDDERLQMLEGYNVTRRYYDENTDSDVVKTMRSFALGGNRVRGMLKVT